MTSELTGNYDQVMGLEDLHGLLLYFASNSQVPLRYQREKHFEITCRRVASAISMTRLGGRRQNGSSISHRYLYTIAPPDRAAPGKT